MPGSMSGSIKDNFHSCLYYGVADIVRSCSCCKNAKLEKNPFSVQIHVYCALQHFNPNNKLCHCSLEDRLVETTNFVMLTFLFWILFYFSASIHTNNNHLDLLLKLKKESITTCQHVC